MDRKQIDWNWSEYAPNVVGVVDVGYMPYMKSEWQVYSEISLCVFLTQKAITEGYKWDMLDGVEISRQGMFGAPFGANNTILKRCMLPETVRILNTLRSYKHNNHHKRLSEPLSQDVLVISYEN